MKIYEEYYKASFSVIPIRADGSLAPALQSWKPNQKEPPSSKELIKVDDIHGELLLHAKSEDNQTSVIVSPIELNLKNLVTKKSNCVSSRKE